MINFTDFVAKYWIQVLFGLVVTFFAAKFRALKIWWKSIQDDKAEKLKRQRMEEVKECIDELKPMLEEIAKQSIAGDQSLHAEINTLSAQVQVLKGGILIIQGDNFKSKCRDILNRGENIDFKTFEALRHDHNTYNALGGNSDGDELFELVKHRYEKDFCS